MFRRSRFFKKQYAMRIFVFLLVVVLSEIAFLLLIHLGLAPSSLWGVGMLIDALMCVVLDFFIVEVWKQEEEGTDDNSVLDEHYEALK